MRTARRARFAGAGLLVVASLSMSGCVFPPGACTAIGWINTLTVDTAAVPGTAELQFCIDDECSPRAEETPAPNEPLPVIGASRDGDEWTLALDMNAPESILIRVFGADGALLLESDEPIAWTHSGDRCGGPSSADPLVLRP